MIGAGCVLTLFVFGFLVCHETLTAIRHQHSAWFGPLSGIVAWIAFMCGYGCSLSIYDWLTRRRNPNRVKDSPWLFAGIWVAFALTATAALGLHRWLLR